MNVDMDCLYDSLSLCWLLTAGCSYLSWVLRAA